MFKVVRRPRILGSGSSAVAGGASLVYTLCPNRVCFLRLREYQATNRDQVCVTFVLVLATYGKVARSAIQVSSERSEVMRILSCLLVILGLGLFVVGCGETTSQDPATPVEDETTDPMETDETTDPMGTEEGGTEESGTE